MELTLIIIVGLLFALVGLVCVALVAIGLPGAWIMLALAVIIELIDVWYLSEGREQTFNWWLLGGCAVVAGIGELLEFLAGALGAKKAGSSRRGMIGAVVGGVVGAILGAGVPLPIIASLIGAVLGTFAGAIIGELTDQEATIKGSIKPATGATIGKILGTVAKIPLAFAIWVALVIAAFWP